tara:strand:+ start:705150 stop:706706 length:1557 start_codon:yes stop_codon:yes gene_type:complete
MIIYQVYPRSFNDSNNDGIGDLAGLEHKLEYIKELGVDAIWISPFFKSPMKDFGYDVADFRAVDSIFGTMDDFKSMLAKATSLGIGIIIDMVMSHTSDEHPWFKDSRVGKHGKSNWYLWANPKADGSAPNNWMSVFGGPAWRWDAERRQYYFHSFFSGQPDLNMHNLEVQDQVLSDIKFWLDLGVTGFRFDACNHIFQDLQLRDNPPREDVTAALHPYGYQIHVYDQAQPEMLPFLERIRTLLDQYGAYSLAEVGGTEPIKLMGQYTRAGHLHSAYSFALMQPDSSAQRVRDVITELEQHIYAPGTPCYALSNHDKPRVASRWANGRDPEQTAKEMLALLYSMRGDICMYQGEELGLPQADVPYDRLQDPFGKSFWPKFKGRDGCRTPMPWNDQVHGGFSQVEPWLPVVDEHRAMNIDKQKTDPDSILNFFKKMIALRKANSALMHGSITLLNTVHAVLAFHRQSDDQKLLCIFNMDVIEHTVHYDYNSMLFGQNVTLQGREIHFGVNGFCILILTQT